MHFHQPSDEAQKTELMIWSFSPSDLYRGKTVRCFDNRCGKAKRALHPVIDIGSTRMGNSVTESTDEYLI